jgi:glycosyltransferase involved in cell wall biosynthesis
LLDVVQRGYRWRVKRAILKHIFSWPTAFLVTGTANRTYYETFDVNAARLFACVHSIDVARFAEPADRYEQEAKQWRRDLGIMNDERVLLFAGKFERKKGPVDLMRMVKTLSDPSYVLIMVGSGELAEEVNACAASNPTRFRVLPFQNQTKMPVVYRLGDVFILPSAFGETWGLAVNEALACSRPILVSDRVGCASDVVAACCGRVFSWSDPPSLTKALNEMSWDQAKLKEMGRAALRRAWSFDVARTEDALMASLSCLPAITLSLKRLAPVS